MHCENLQRQLDDYLTGNLSDPAASAVTMHLQHCDACRRRYLQMQKLLHALHTLPVAPPRAGYARRVLAFLPHKQDRPAPARQRISWYTTGFASALLLMLAVGFVFTRTNSLTGHSLSTLTLDVSPSHIQKVSLVFHSPEQITRATLRIELPAGVDINGYAQQRILQWQTNLQRGSNRLVLPLRITGDAGGMLTARLSHDGHSRIFKLRILTHDTSSQRSTTQHTV